MKLLYERLGEGEVTEDKKGGDELMVVGTITVAMIEMEAMDWWWKKLWFPKKEEERDYKNMIKES